MGGRIVGFYTDRKGRIRPITSGKKLKPPRPSERVHATLMCLISQPPVMKEISIAYLIANTLYDMYEKGSTDIIRDALSPVQANIVWNALQPHIPVEIHGVAKPLLINVVNRITNEEIKLVEQYLQKRKGQKGVMFG